MEWLGCLAAFFGIAFIGWIFQAIQNALQKSTVKKTVQEEMKVRCHGDQLTTDSGKKMDFMRVTVSGTCMVPSDNYPCRIHLKAIDVTDGYSEENILPILSLFPDMADENGFLATSTELTMPYQFTTFEDLQIGVLVPDYLVLPKRGTRKIRILTWITPITSTREIYKAGSLDLNYQQKAYGYLEQAKRDLDADKLIAQLAVILCAADGAIEQPEMQIIHRFFEQRMLHRDDAEGHREKISQTLIKAINNSGTQNSDIHRQIQSLAKKLLAFDDSRIFQEAYELCTQITAADNKVSKAEQLTLKIIAEELNISKNVVREIHDRYFSVDMFRERSRDALIDMPAGLSTDEQISFLNREYQKWRSRVTHKDAKIRTEAEIRLKHITRSRRALDEKQ